MRRDKPSKTVFSLFFILYTLSIGIWFTGKLAMAQNTKTIIPVNVGVVLDMDSKGDVVGAAAAGDSTSPPKGWQIPPNGTKLKIGVPIKMGIVEFLNVTTNSDTKAVNVTGYSIDVLKAVVAALPFPTPDGKNAAGTYDHNLYAVVGDIIANRSKYIILPFTESGVTMIVPINKGKKVWDFLKPMTLNLWLTTVCSSIFVGFAIWVLEHRINEDFKGPPSHQVATAVGFTFSTMVLFAPREKVVSNLSRFVVIIWCFVVLILTQSYTASFTTILTVGQLKPTILNDLILRGDYVGYRKDSLVAELLKESLNFSKIKLKAYGTLEECNDLLSKGSEKGGISAAFDEISYMRIFLGKYCGKYTMVGPTYKTDEFGFVFPIGSPLIDNVSSAILNVTQGSKMVEIEKKWFNKDNCPDHDSSSSDSSYSLGVDCFWGLFLIAGITSVLALMIFVILLVHKNKNIFFAPPTLPTDQLQPATSSISLAVIVPSHEHEDSISPSLLVT